MAERRLILMRHATAASGAGLASDHERPLTARGTSQAAGTGARLAAAGWVPDRVLLSDSARTVETWWCMAHALGDPPAVQLSSLYGAGMEGIAAAVQRLDPSARTVLLLGHNPGFSEAIGWLSGGRVELAPADAGLLVGWGATWSDVLGAGALAVHDVLRTAD